MVLQNTIELPLEEIGEGYVLYFHQESQLIQMATLKSIRYIAERELKEISLQVMDKQSNIKKSNLQIEIAKKNLIKRIMDYNISEETLKPILNYIENSFVHLYFSLTHNQLNIENWVFQRSH